MSSNAQREQQQQESYKAPRIRTSVYPAILKLLDEYGFDYYNDAEDYSRFYNGWFVPSVLRATEQADKRK